MQINFLWDASVLSAPAGFKPAMQAAAGILDSQILDPISVTLNVGWGETGGTAISSATALATAGPDNYVSLGYAQLQSDLTHQASANGVASIAANLPAADPTNGSGSWEVSQALAKALNISIPNASATDGSVGFASDVDWNFSLTQPPTPTQYDFLGTALHEITHALGRVNFASPGFYDPLNLYTYAAPGTLQLNQTTPAYFSVNGGTADLNNFDMSAGGDTSDWATSLTDSFGPGPQGVTGPMSAADWLVMESLGFKIAPTYILFGPGSANKGAHDLLELSTVNVPAGSSVNYSISGLTASQLSSGHTSGTITLGANGTAVLDLGIASGALGTGTTQATITLGNNLATFNVVVDDAANNAVNLAPGAPAYFNTAANDTITGAASDTVVYSGNFADYVITRSADSIQVWDPIPARDGTDTLVGVQRVQFQDKSVAFDLQATQPGGETAEILGAAFGKSALANKSYVGIGLGLFDSGQTMQQVAQLCLNADPFNNLGHGTDYTAFVATVWKNVMGTAIDATNLETFTNALSSHQMTSADLLVLAAQSQFNQTHIDLVGLYDSGLAFG